MTLNSMIDSLRVNQELKMKLFHHRITWILGKPFVQAVRAGKTYAEAGVILRAATPADMQAMSEGRLSFDSETEPGRKAWEKHVAEGGD